MSRRQRKLRVLVGSHGHPAIHPGGAEIAAYSLFQALQARPDTEAWFLGCDRGRLPPRAGPCITQPFATDREFIYAGGAFDWFRFANHHTEFAPAFAALLMELRPDVLHLHHYLNFGVEVFSIARRALPDLRIFLTLHEYLAICHNVGQMVKHPSRALCYQESPAACHACFPDLQATEFYLRKRYLQRLMAEADGFIAPSRFLAGRYTEWGLPANLLQVIPNVATSATPTPATHRHPDRPLHVGFFGQIFPLKGIGVLLNAAGLLDRAGSDIVFDIHGTDAGQLPDTQAEFRTQLANAGPNVRYHGPYPPERVDALMQAVDVVVGTKLVVGECPIGHAGSCTERENGHLLQYWRHGRAGRGDRRRPVSDRERRRFGANSAKDGESRDTPTNQADGGYDQHRTAYRYLSIGHGATSALRANR